MKPPTQQSHFTICPHCHGLGKMMRGPSKKRWRLFQAALSEYEISDGTGAVPQPPTENLDACIYCAGSGLLPSEHAVPPDHKKYPHIAIIGGGMGGTALAVACLHRGIPFTLYERDARFNARSQGYGLTLQQASKAIEGLGIFSLDDGITSTKHVVHNPDGKIIGEWGLRKWKREYVEKTTRRRNVHIARQTLRLLLLEQLGTTDSIKWGHKLIDFSHNPDGTVNLNFDVHRTLTTAHADLIVGADGIHSVVRNLIIGEQTPLQYLGCMVILGICPLAPLQELNSPLLDSATVFQTVNGHERIYMMPYDKDTIMWQLSFPLPEADAKKLSTQGAEAMKKESCKRLALWHSPIPQILQATDASQITGYPVYDRALFDATLLQEKGSVTLLGDAAHPMSPFKGQGANQALLDALTLARKISVACDSNPQWRDIGVRNLVLKDFEQEMAQRSASKVEGSAHAVELLHSPAVLHEGNEPRGRGLNIKA